MAYRASHSRIQSILRHSDDSAPSAALSTRPLSLAILLSSLVVTINGALFGGGAKTLSFVLLAVGVLDYDSELTAMVYVEYPICSSRSSPSMGRAHAVSGSGICTREANGPTIVLSTLPPPLDARSDHDLAPPANWIGEHPSGSASFSVLACSLAATASIRPSRGSQPGQVDDIAAVGSILLAPAGTAVGTFLVGWLLGRSGAAVSRLCWACVDAAAVLAVGALFFCCVEGLSRASQAMAFGDCCPAL